MDLGRGRVMEESGFSGRQCCIDSNARLCMQVKEKPPERVGSDCLYRLQVPASDTHETPDVKPLETPDMKPPETRDMKPT